MEPIYAVVADLVVLVHLCYVLFAVGGEVLVLAGGLLRWAWVRNLGFRIAHLLSVVVVAIEALVGVLCPLTEWEHTLRRLGGQAAEKQIPFMARLVRRLIFYDLPQWVFTTAYVVFALLVVGSLLLFPPERRRGRPAGPEGAGLEGAGLEGAGPEAGGPALRERRGRAR